MSQNLFEIDCCVVVATPYPLHQAYQNHLGTVRKINQVRGGSPLYVVTFENADVAFCGGELRKATLGDTLSVKLTLAPETIQQIQDVKKTWDELSEPVKQTVMKCAQLAEKGRRQPGPLGRTILRPVEPQPKVEAPKLAIARPLEERLKEADIVGVGSLSATMKNGSCSRCGRPGHVLFGASRCQNVDASGRRCGGTVR